MAPRRGEWVYDIYWWSRAEADCAEIASESADAGLGLVDASLIALAERLETERIATLDERHFRTVRPRTRGASFVLLPADR